MLKTIFMCAGLLLTGLVHGQKGVKCETPFAYIEDLYGNDLGNPTTGSIKANAFVVRSKGYYPAYYITDNLGKKKELDLLVPIKNSKTNDLKLELRGVKIHLPKDVTTFGQYKSIENFKKGQSASYNYQSILRSDLDYYSAGLWRKGTSLLKDYGFTEDSKSFFSSKKRNFSFEIEFNRYTGGHLLKTDLMMHKCFGVITVYDCYNEEVGEYFFSLDMFPTLARYRMDGGFIAWSNSIYLDDWVPATELAITSFLQSEFLEKLLEDWDKKLVAFEQYDPLQIKSISTSVKSVAESMECVVTLESKDGHGSGCIVSDDGYLVTNYHVAFGSKDTLYAVLSSGEKYTVDVVRQDPEGDLALLKINGDRTFKSLKVNQQPQLKLGQSLSVIGTPANSALGQTVTKGILSGERDAFGVKLFQTDAHINPGNSGGALLDENGVLVGIVSSKAIGSIVEGVGFAISSENIFTRLKLTY